MIRALAAALALVCAAPAYAQTTQCFPVEVVRHAMAPFVERGAELVPLSGQDAQAYIEALNEYPPKSHIAADGLLLVVVPGHDVSVWLIEGKAACWGGRIGPDVNAKMMLALKEKKA